MSTQTHLERCQVALKECLKNKYETIRFYDGWNLLTKSVLELAIIVGDMATVEMFMHTGENGYRVASAIREMITHGYGDNMKLFFASQSRPISGVQEFFNCSILHQKLEIFKILVDTFKPDAELMESFLYLSARNLSHEIFCHLMQIVSVNGDDAMMLVKAAVYKFIETYKRADITRGWSYYHEKDQAQIELIIKRNTPKLDAIVNAVKNTNILNCQEIDALVTNYTEKITEQIIRENAQLQADNDAACDMWE